MLRFPGQRVTRKSVSAPKIVCVGKDVPLCQEEGHRSCYKKVRGQHHHYTDIIKSKVIVTFTVVMATMMTKTSHVLFPPFVRTWKQKQSETSPPFQTRPAGSEVT